MPAANLNDFKPKMTSSELIRMMKEEKGILFNQMNERKAEEYLKERNNYFRTAAYRKNYPKYQQGPNKGKYIRLEFSYLCEMATLDTYFRNILLQMCLDVEHALKVQLLADIEDDDSEDGYTLVNDFLAAFPAIKTAIAYTSNSSFSNGLIDKYFEIDCSDRKPLLTYSRCPVWVLSEILTFGHYTRLYNFYYVRSGRKEKILEKGIINPVRTLRNACGHNNCILFDLSDHVETTRPCKIVTEFVSEIPGIGSRERYRMLTRRPLLEICCLLIAEKQYVSESVNKHQMNIIYGFMHNRLLKYPEAYRESRMIRSAFDFLSKMVDFCYSECYK